MFMRPRYEADLLSYLCNLSINPILMGCHSVKSKGQLVGRLTKGFIGLGLDCYEVLHKTLLVRFRLYNRTCTVESSILDSKRLHRTLGLMVGVLL